MPDIAFYTNCFFALAFFLCALTFLWSPNFVNYMMDESRKRLNDGQQIFRNFYIRRGLFWAGYHAFVAIALYLAVTQ